MYEGISRSPGARCGARRVQVTSITASDTQRPLPRERMSTGIVRDETIWAANLEPNREGALYQSALNTGVGATRDSMDRSGPELVTSTKSSNPGSVGSGLPGGGGGGVEAGASSTLPTTSPSS